MSATDNAHRVVAKIGVAGVEKELEDMIRHGNGGHIRWQWQQDNGCDILDAYAVGIKALGGRP